jgi:hypothetical protein
MFSTPGYWSRHTGICARVGERIELAIYVFNRATSRSFADA